MLPREKATKLLNIATAANSNNNLLKSLRYMHLILAILVVEE